MPELPEVETTRSGIAPSLLGQRVREVIVRQRRLRWPITAGFEAAVRGRVVTSVERRAKYILIGFDSGTAIVHLGMSGSLRILDPATPLLTHDHWDIVLGSGRALRFHDPRRFGSLLFTQVDPHRHPLLAGLAPEPLSDAFDADYLYRVSRRRKVAVKLFIMNSQVVVGVGNIYASESLFRAGIAPRRMAGRLTSEQCARLVRAIKDVLRAAVRAGGTTLRDYVNADGTPGYFSQRLFVYERAELPCRRCRTPIRQFVQGQRSTYWCPTCQK
ncbi:MAG: bifunctional DNA-formamidopyrimidine glycosylase/DNA-(apurinic or apyrimidinic site) lyase [Proteobacteria bacterium]|nr:bifunctional DNA-formamidopyrimidine glycosylase/DNA-(apurinic or apyrimidinic site) lyase [Pseudomonadota bacterium]